MPSKEPCILSEEACTLWKRALHSLKRARRLNAKWYGAESCHSLAHTLSLSRTHAHTQADASSQNDMGQTPLVCASMQVLCVRNSMRESWRTTHYERVMSHICRSHVTHMNESCHTYVGVMSHILMSHVTHMNELCHTYEWVMSHIWMSHVLQMNESCLTYECSCLTYS